MMHLLIDTNIVIDLLAQREAYYTEAAELFSKADRKEIQLSVSALTFANTHYILTKLKSSREARLILGKFKVLVATLSLDDKITELALNHEKFKDFEDGLQYYTAIENGVDIIITRNKKDFKHAALPVLTAKEFLTSNN